MRDAFPILWWLAAAVVIALLLISMGYAASQAILLAVFFLPGMLCARYFYPQLSFEERRKGVLDTLYLTLAILCIEYLALILGHRTALPDDEIPDLLFNPLFILLVLSACILPEILIERPARGPQALRPHAPVRLRPPAGHTRPRGAALRRVERQRGMAPHPLG